MSNQQQDKRTASQRIDDMERGLMALYQTADNMARDLMTIKEAIKLLGNKLDAVVKTAGLNDDDIAKAMVQNNVDELKEKVTDLLNKGIFAVAEEVGPNSFVVGREIDENGVIVNPRMQFVVSALTPEVKDKFPGAKAGQILELQEGKWKFEVQEVYSIQTPEQVPAPAPVEAQEAAAPSES